MKKLILFFAAMVALGSATAFAAGPWGGGSTSTSSFVWGGGSVTPTPFVWRGGPTADFRVDMSCTPLTNSQLAETGDAQSCTIRLRNFGSAPIEGITFDRPTPNTVTARYSAGWKPVACDLSGCEPFTLGASETVLIVEESTFNPYEDGRGLTKATANGTQAGVSVTGSGTEQMSLP